MGKKILVLVSVVATIAAVVGATAIARVSSQPNLGVPSALAPIAPSEVVLLASSSGPIRLATEKGTAQAHPGGIAVPGTNRVISVPTTGKSLEGLEVNVISGSERFAALTPPRSPGATPWLPDGRERTRLTVLDLDSQEQRAFHLPGNFQPEAFSVDDRTLFLIEYLPALRPSHYTVRRLNLANGSVLPIARLKLAAPGVMRGTGRMQVLAPDEKQLYTLYTRQGPNYAHGETDDSHPGKIHAFVHVLDLQYRWAHCIDLPEPFGTGDATASALAVSPEGTRMFVTDWTNGAIATINPKKLRVDSVDMVELGGADDSTFAATSGERLFVAGNDSVVALDAQSMEVIGRWRAPAEVTGVSVSPEGAGVYVTSGNDRVTLLTDDLQTVSRSWSVPGVTGFAG